MASNEAPPNKNFFERLMEYRFSKTFTDLTIKIGEREFHVHKIVLVDASPVLNAMISERWLKDDILEFKAEVVDPEIFEDLLNFLYINKIQLTPKNVKLFVKAAHFLDVSGLLRLCENFMIKQVSEQNFNDFYDFSKSFTVIFPIYTFLKGLAFKII